MAIERLLKLKIADLIVELIDEHKLRAIDLARETGWRPGDISQMYSTARAFPRRSRPRGAKYNHLLLATRMTRKFPELRMSPNQAYARILSAGLTQHRDVGRMFAELAQKTERDARSLRLVVPPQESDDLLNKMHHCRFQDLRAQFADGSVKFIHIDPVYIYPYGIYQSRSSRSRTCDGTDRESAIAGVVDLFRDWQPILSASGVLGIWQPWGSLMVEYQEAAEKYRWRTVGPIIWDKIRPQPGDLGSPFAPHGEMLWLFHRSGEKLANHDRSSREMILRVPPMSFPALAAQQTHTFEKPVELLARLVRKLTQPGEVVADFCACSGAMSLAAIACERQWIYVESNLDNYRLGSERIAASLAARHAAAS